MELCIIQQMLIKTGILLNVQSIRMIMISDQAEGDQITRCVEYFITMLYNLSFSRFLYYPPHYFAKHRLQFSSDMSGI